MTTVMIERKRNLRWDIYVLLAMLGYVFLGDPMIRVYEQHFMHRPFITATLEIVPVDGAPGFKYDADAVASMDAVWTATIYSENGTRLRSRKGQGSYSSAVDEPKPWTWEAFFETKPETSPPLVPHIPFYVCLRYDAETHRGVEDRSPQRFCSNVFNPNEVAQ